jgi:hypothetical protein
MKLFFTLTMFLGGALFVFTWHLLFVPTLKGIRDSDNDLFGKIMGSYEWKTFEVPVGAAAGFGKMMKLSPVLFRFTKYIALKKSVVDSFYRKTFLISLSLAVFMLVGGVAGFVYIIPKIQ